VTEWDWWRPIVAGGVVAAASAVIALFWSIARVGND
jgi:hypothetical protein